MLLVDSFLSSVHSPLVSGGPCRRLVHGMFYVPSCLQGAFGLGVITGDFLATDRYLDSGFGWDDVAGRYTCPSSAKQN